MGKPNFSDEFSRVTQPFTSNPNRQHREIQPHTASRTLSSFKDGSAQRLHAVATVKT